MDLLDALSSVVTDAQPTWNPSSGSHTPADARANLEKWGREYRTVAKPGRDGGIQFEFAICPLCNSAEGNPAVWVVDGNLVFKCQRANCGCADKTYRDLAAHFAPSKVKRVSLRDVAKTHFKPRESVVDGLIRRGDVCNFVGGPKARKSFLVLQLALSVASGTPFLRWPTVQGRVLLIDNELRGDDLTQRARAVTQAMGIAWDDVADNLDISLLRGSMADLRTVRDDLCNTLPTYSLVVFDALYKLLPKGTDENSNTDITQCYILLDETAEKHNCGCAVVHHTSKGSQHQKSVSDMGSGAGAQSRSADVHCVIRDHADKDTVVLQAIVRSQKPVEPTVLEFRYPLWHVTEKNPDDLAAVNRKALPTLDKFLETIPFEPAAKTPTLENARFVLATSEATIGKLLHKAMEDGLVEINKPKSRQLPHTVRRIKKAAA